MAALRDAGQPTGHGLYKSGDGPWRLHYQLTGLDRVSTGRSLQGKLTELGYETDVSVTTSPGDGRRLWADSRPVDSRPHAKVERGADLCKRNPAAWSAAVRYEDQLVATGVDRTRPTGW